MSRKPMKPLLRKALDITPVTREGETFFAVRDPLGLAGEQILVPGPILFLMSLMDGKATITDLQVEFTRKFGQLIMSDKVRGIIEELDARGFLESPAFRRRRENLEAEWRKSPVREASLAGEAYPADEKELEALLEEIVPAAGPFPGAEGGGGTATGASPGPKGGRGCAGKFEGSPGKTPAGIVAPHIDIDRGRAVYGLAYSALAGAKPPRRAVIFGTGHFAQGGPYILTRKNFQTPLGEAQSDGAFIDRLVAACPFDTEKGELAHRTEHSIEFQVLFLQHIFGKENMPLIAPVLCTSFESIEKKGKDAPPAGRSPADLPEVAGFLAACREAAGASEGGVLFVAGADMAHVGPKFGGDAPLSKADLARVEREDRAALEAAAAEGAEGFFREVSRIGNRNNICSVVSIYTILKLLEGEKREVLGYGMAPEPEGYAAVGFGALRIGG